MSVFAVTALVSISTAFAAVSIGVATRTHPVSVTIIVSAAVTVLGPTHLI